MDERPAVRHRAAAGGIAASAPAIGDAVLAVRLPHGMDWRPLVGLTEADRGTLVELVLARTVLDLAHESHEADVRAANRGT